MRFDITLPKKSQVLKSKYAITGKKYVSKHINININLVIYIDQSIQIKV